MEVDEKDHAIHVTMWMCSSECHDFVAEFCLLFFFCSLGVLNHAEPVATAGSSSGAENNRSFEASTVGSAQELLASSEDDQGGHPSSVP